MNEATIKLCLHNLYEALSVIEQMEYDYEKLYEDSNGTISEDDYFDMKDDFERWYEDILDLTTDIESKFDLI